jgi:hypothetical protein
MVKGNLSHSQEEKRSSSWWTRNQKASGRGWIEQRVSRESGWQLPEAPDMEAYAQ